MVEMRVDGTGKNGRGRRARRCVFFSVIREIGFPAGSRTRIAAFARPYASIAPRESGRGGWTCTSEGQGPTRLQRVAVAAWLLLELGAGRENCTPKAHCF